MRKLLFLFSAILIAAVGFSQVQSVRIQQELRKDDFTNGVVRTAVHHQATPVAKNMMEALSEDFEAGAGLPAGWITTPDNPWAIADAADFDNLTNHTTGDAGNVAFFDCWTYSAAEEGQIWTPKLSVTAGDATFSFWINYWLISGEYGNTAELYIAVSNDNGETWTESATNLIAGQQGADWFQHTIDLTAFESMDYTDDNVIVRLRAVSDYGSYNIGVDDFEGPEIYVPANPDLQLMGMLDVPFTMLPLDQVVEITPTANVMNVGNELTDATDVDFAITGETYNESVALTVPMANGAVESVTPATGFTPAANGVFEFTMEATVANDDNPADNSATTSITITENEMAYDNEDIVGQLGAGTGAMLGNRFVFNADGGLTGAKFYITDDITEGYDCTVKVIDFTGGVAGDVLAESGTITVAGSTSAWYEAEFSGLNVTAGQDVLIMVDNISAAVFMALARDANYVENVGYVSTDGAEFSEVGGLGFPNIFLVRALTGEPPACPTPSALTATNITTTGADLAWTSTADTWNIEWGMQGFTQGEGTLIEGTTDNPYSLTDLDPGTAYAFYVQADCGVDGTSDWAGPFVFTTEVVCGVIDTYPFFEGFETAVPPACWLALDEDGDSYNWTMIDYNFNSGSYAAMSASFDNDFGELTPDNYLITPQLDINTDNLELRFWVAAQDPDWAEEKFSVMVSTTGTAPADFTEIYTETLSSDVWSEVVLSLADYNGELIYIAIRHWDCTDMYQLVLDDFLIDFETGISETLAPIANIYPNPSTGLVNISSANGAEISVSNMLGQEVYRTVSTQDVLTIDASTWGQGSYMVRVIENGEVSVMKFNIVK
jgi:hypothetical protein